MKIRTRIIIGFLIIVTAGFYYLTHWLLNDLRPHYTKSMEESMVDMAALLSSWVSSESDTMNVKFNDLKRIFDETNRRSFSAKIYDVTKNKINLRVYITDKNGIVLYDSDDGRSEGQDFSRWRDVRLTLQGRYGARTTRENPADPRTSRYYVGFPIKVKNQVMGVLTVSKPVASVNQFILQARTKIIIAAVIAGFSVFLLGIALSFWITQPILNLTKYAYAIRDGQKVKPLKLGKTEIGKMGKAFEEMRDALEGKKYVEQYIQTLTHEIKNPLSGIKGASELLKEDLPTERRDQFIENIFQESNRIQEIIDRMLQLAGVESQKSLEDVETIDLSSLLGTLIKSFETKLEKKRIECNLELTPKIQIKGEPFLIRQSIVNLIQNAMDFCSPGDSITIRTELHDNKAHILIEDTGSGIPEYALSRIFERFYSLRRPDSQRKSTGLGLSFVKEVSELHHGSIRISNLEEGGTKVIFILPAV